MFFTKKKRVSVLYVIQYNMDCNYVGHDNLEMTFSYCPMPRDITAEHN